MGVAVLGDVGANENHQRQQHQYSSQSFGAGEGDTVGFRHGLSIVGNLGIHGAGGGNGPNGPGHFRGGADPAHCFILAFLHQAAGGPHGQ